ncbi:MAG: glycosyltransferase [Rickettsiales bacterium]|nr:glycosyltransferase [Rickettsiales bacterium]
MLKIFKNSVYELNLYGKTNKKMINKISKFGNNIKYNGFYHLSEKNKIFSKYDFFILTSDYTEGFGYVLIDAIFNCTPIILRDTYPAARFLVNNGKNGLLLKKNWSPKKCHAEIKN